MDGTFSLGYLSCGVTAQVLHLPKPGQSGPSRRGKFPTVVNTGILIFYPPEPLERTGVFGFLPYDAR